MIDNFRPGTMEKLGIDYNTLKDINHRIICASGTAFGTKGPWIHRPAFDPIIQAMTGLLSLTGEPGEASMPVGVPIADLATGISITHGVLAALYDRERNGRGRQVEVTMLGATLALLTFDAAGYLLSGELPEPRGRTNMAVQPYGVFETKNGSIVIAAHRSFDRICKALGCEEMIDDDRFNTLEGRVVNRKELVPIIKPILKTKTSEEWEKILEAADVPCCSANTLDKAISHPQVKELGMVAEFDYVLGGKIRAVGNPIKISDTPKDTRDKFISPPMPGQNTREILTRLLSYGPDKINSLITDGVIGEWVRDRQE